MFNYSLKIGFVLASAILCGVFCEPDENRNTNQLIESKGYICEEHEVLTDDGYILSMQRVLKRNSTGVLKDIVFLQHGLLDSSASWVLNTANQSLGFILADAGYDVWLGNTRGNIYSNRHKTLDPSSTQFWDFSIDEMAKYDLPAMIDYSLRVTNKTSLYYVGHSQGTLIGFVEFGKNNDLASKIKLFIALAPVGTVGNIKTPLKHLTGPPFFFNKFWDTLVGKREFLNQNMKSLIKWFGGNLCADTTGVCEETIFMIAGPTNGLNKTRIPVYLSHYPSGASSKNVLHFSQLVYSKNIQMFDYGHENFKHYNQMNPPLYDVSKVLTPVALMSSSNDWLATLEDVEYLRKNLPNIVFDRCLEKLDHLDFTWGLDASTLIYPNVIDLLKKFA